jgi:plasmid stability protein
MATLNIKKFPDALYEKLREQARRERRSISQEVIRTLEQALKQDEPLSLLGLQGLGKDLWEGIDAVEFIREERDSWDR